MIRLIHTAFAMSLVMVLLNTSASIAAELKDSTVCSVVIKASPSVVYDSIRSLRKIEPKNVKELSRATSHTVIEETFHVLPVIGKTVCVYKETYKPKQQIAYKMVSSNRFHAFEGKWTIKPANDGNTKLSLSSYIDPGMHHIPFAKQITKMETKKGIKKRLKAVKRISEKKQLAMSKSQTN